MKKITRLLAFLGLFLSLLFVGCEKETNEVPEIYIPEITPTYTVNETTRGIVQMITLSWASKFADSCFLNGEYIPLKGSKDVEIIEDTDFTFEAKNAQKTTIFVLKVKKLDEPIPPTVHTSFTFNDEAIDTLPYFGGPVKIKVVFTDGVLYLNTVRYENSPAIFDFTVTETKTYDFVVIGPGGETSGSITIPVRVPGVYESLVTGGNFRKWNIYKYEKSYEPDANYIPYEGDYEVTWTFYLLPQKMYNQNESSWDWNINGNIISGFGDREIISYAGNEMVLRQITAEIGSNRNVWVKEYLKIID